MLVCVRKRVSLERDDPAVVLLSHVQHLAKFTNTVVGSVFPRSLNRRVRILYLALHSGCFGFGDNRSNRRVARVSGARGTAIDVMTTLLVFSDTWVYESRHAMVEI
jgi:hypothetical protein